MAPAKSSFFFLFLNCVYSIALTTRMYIRGATKLFFNLFLLVFPLQLKSEMRSHVVVTQNFTGCNQSEPPQYVFESTVKLVIRKR